MLCNRESTAWWRKSPAAFSGLSAWLMGVAYIMTGSNTDDPVWTQVLIGMLDDWWCTDLSQSSHIKMNTPPQKQFSHPRYQQETWCFSTHTEFKLDLWTLCFLLFCQYEHTFCFTHPWCWCLIDYQCATELDFSWGLIVWLRLLEDNRSRSKILIQLHRFTLMGSGESKQRNWTQPLQIQRKCSSCVYLSSNHWPR